MEPGRSTPTLHTIGDNGSSLSLGHLQTPENTRDTRVPGYSLPAYGHGAHRPPPILIEKGDERTSYEAVNSGDPHTKSYNDPYEPQYDDDTIPLVNVRHRSKGDKSKRFSTALPSTPLPRSPVPRGLTGGRGWLERFEPAPTLPLVIHTVLCLVSFPIVMYLTPLADGLAMFWTRVIVGGICGLVGLSLGVSLLDLSRRGIEAALWATIIHESMDEGMGGVTLQELDYHTANPESPWAAILLLYRRWFKHRGTGRSKRRQYDAAPWSLYIVLFLFTATVAACLVFVFGRVVDIRARQETQINVYEELAIIGDLSPEDIQRAATLNATFRSYTYTWSLTPFSASAHLPKDRSFMIQRATGSGVEDAVHFAETYTRQLVPGGTGFGTFFPNTTAVWANATSTGVNATTIASGQILRWPRWGERTVCQTIEEMGNGSIILDPRRGGPESKNMTYGYVTKTAVTGLLRTAEVLSGSIEQLRPADISALMEPGDLPPMGINNDDIAFTGKWWDNGVAHQFRTQVLNQGDSGNGWTMLEVVFVRLNESYAPQSQFHQYWDGVGDANSRTRIGLDAALCVHEVRPYMLDAYNNTAGLPTTLAYMYGGDKFNVTGKKMQGEWMSGVQRGLNSSQKWVAFSNAFFNARNVMLKDNGRDFWYVPNPTVVSFTGNTEPDKYTKLRSPDLQDVLGDVDSQHLLPYLVGSQPIVAHLYPDKTVAYTKVFVVWLIGSLIGVLILGFVVAIFVPRLPLGLPRRDFGIFSWLAAIEGDSLVNLPVEVGRYERLEDLRVKAKNVPLRYAAPGEGI